MQQEAVIINHGKIVIDSSVKALKYGYMKRKIIDVKFAAISDHSMLDGLNVIKRKGLSMKLEVDEGDGIQEVMLRLMQAGSILDVTVSDVPMEKIIGDIYRDKGLDFIDPNADTARVESVTNRCRTRAERRRGHEEAGQIFACCKDRN